MVVIHIITGLGNGGAEGVLYRLVKYDQTHEHIVVSLKSSGKYLELLENKNIKVYQLGVNSFFSALKAIVAIRKIIVAHRPNVVLSWLYHADFLASLACLSLRYQKLIWNIRNSNLEVGKSKAFTRFLVRLLALLSRVSPEAIISCSQKATNVHISLGYRDNIFAYIPNGFDPKILKPMVCPGGDLVASSKTNNFRVGLLGRWSPQKGHQNLFAALQKFRSNNDHCNVTLHLAGAGICPDNGDLTELLKKFDLDKVCVLHGEVSDISKWFSLLDVHILPSGYGEAFPNVVAESMLCSVPCIGTDVGDTADIIGDMGWIIEPNNVDEMTKAISKSYEKLISFPEAWDELKGSCRKKMINEFSIHKMVERYIEIISSIDNKKKHRKRWND